ncbi:hypothetical protein ACS3UN_06110 [Oscillospiraceae bacterium LTW-04]|nr:hypothetical protein RBH76_04250 [Oscillospiraceae bacterium MB24-C1]
MLSVLLGLAGAALEIHETAKHILLIVWFGVIAVVSVAINLLWLRSFNKQLKALLPILSEEHRNSIRV